jgi:hypothetical protein
MRQLAENKGTVAYILNGGSIKCEVTAKDGTTITLGPGAVSVSMSGCNSAKYADSRTQARYITPPKQQESVTCQDS